MDCRDVRGLFQICYECKVPSTVHIRQQSADHAIDSQFIPVLQPLQAQMASQPQVSEHFLDLSTAMDLSYSAKFASLTDQELCGVTESANLLVVVAGDQMASGVIKQTSAHDCADFSTNAASLPKASASGECLSNCGKLDLPLHLELQCDSKSEAELSRHVLQPKPFKFAHDHLVLAHLAPPPSPPDLDPPETHSDQSEIEFEATQNFQPEAASGIHSEPVDIAGWVFNSLGLQNVMALISMQPPQAGPP